MTGGDDVVLVRQQEIEHPDEETVSAGSLADPVGFDAGQLEELAHEVRFANDGAERVDLDLVGVDGRRLGKTADEHGAAPI